MWDFSECVIVIVIVNVFCWSCVLFGAEGSAVGSAKTNPPDYHLSTPVQKTRKGAGGESKSSPGQKRVVPSLCRHLASNTSDQPINPSQRQ